MGFGDALAGLFPKARKVYGHIASIRMSPKEKADSFLNSLTYLGLMSSEEKLNRLIALNKKVDGPVCSIRSFVHHFEYEAGNVLRRRSLAPGRGAIRKSGSWIHIDGVSNVGSSAEEPEFYEGIVKTGNAIFDTKELRQDFYKELLESPSFNTYGKDSAIPFFKEMSEAHAPNG